MRGRRTAFEDLIIIAGRLPWQAGLVLALLSLVVLHVIAVHLSLPTATRGNVNFGAIYTRTLLATVAKLTQFIIPPALLIGAGTSAWRRSRASALADGSGPSGAAGAESLSWSEFEQLVAELFRRQGYAVTENLIGGPDGGVDLVLRKVTNARTLGRWLAGNAKERGAQIVVASHSADFLLGVISADADASIVRLNRNATGTTFRVIPSATTSGLIQSPLLSSLPVLDSLFHRGVVVCEGDPDRAIYQTVLHHFLRERGNRPA